MILTLFLSLCLVSGTDINLNDSINLKGNTNPTQIITVYNNRILKLIIMMLNLKPKPLMQIIKKTKILPTLF